MAVGLNYKVLKQFFDRPAVKNRVDATARRNLSKAGAYVRTSARSSMRRRKASALAGQPPSAHVGGMKKIVFAYDPAAHSVVCGPLQFNIDGGKVPALLEFGGTIRRRYVRRKGSNGKWRRFDNRRNDREDEEYRTFTDRYRGNPYMAPALEREAPKFPALWANTVGAAA